MKTIPGFLTLLFVFSVLGSFSQEQLIKLNLKEGYEYIFEKVDKNYGLKTDNSRVIKSSETKEIRLAVEDVVLGEKTVFTLEYLKNIIDGAFSETLLNRTDYFFPNFIEGETSYFDQSDCLESLLCRAKLRFSVDLRTNEIVLLNRVELLEQFHERLLEQKIRRENISEYIQWINNRKFFVDDDLVTFLTWFNNSELGADQTLTKTAFDEKLIVRERNGDFLKFGDMDFDKIIPGKRHEKYWLNLENGMVTHFSTIQRDSLRSRFDLIYRKVVWEVNETDFRLLYEQKIPDQTLFISGKIEKPLSNKVHIRYLDEPFDVILKTKTVLLDENGSFSAQLDFSHAGFVYVENENNNKHNPPGTFVFYAEPGDTIHFESMGKELPWKTTVTGTRPNEQKLIQELREKINIYEKGRRLTGRSYVIFDNEIAYGVNLNNLGKGEIEILHLLFQAIDDAGKIIAAFPSEIPVKSKRFIENEFKAYLYGGIFRQNRLIISKNFGPNSLLEAEETQQMMRKTDQIDIHEVYNDYGLHSRQCIFEYLGYHSSRISKVRYWYSSGMVFQVPPEPELDLQFSRMILTGSPLYREIGKNLVQILERRSHTRSSRISDDYLDDFVLKKFGLMLQKCNDNEVTDKINHIVSQFKKLKPGNFVPELDLVDIDNKKVSYRDFINGKPTVVYFSDDWIGDRYEYDMMGEGMPGLNFVMVVEGSNFEQWKEYTRSAQPAITHLLFLNNQTTFRDIFQRNSVHLVFNKKGELVGQADSPKEAAQMAIESLEPQKKELNKSQLIMIIWVLGIMFTIAIAVLAIWKWRVRQRFRKEAQKRRLRELELTAIRSQMNPHFLFNCLNSVQNLVQQNKGREAHLYLADFAGVIRKVLQNSEKEEVSLAEELEMTRQYLNLEKLRFDFGYSISVEQNIDANNTMVPSMLLQPFAENAVIHGLYNKSGNRKLSIEVLRKGAGRGRDESKGRGRGEGGDQGIVIRIEDNGIGREAAREIAGQKNGKGSKLVQERLEILQQKQGEKYRLEITDLTGEVTGTRVEIFIPEEN